MIAFLLIVAFPVIAGLGYGLFHLAGRVLTAGRGSETLGRYTMVVYAAMLWIPLVAVLLALSLSTTSVAATGLAWPVLFGLSPWLATPLAVGVGVAVGVLLYRGEVWARQPRLPAAGVQTELPQTDLRYLADGHTEAVVRQAQQLPGLLLLPMTLFVAGAEELLWRGYLIAFAMQDFAFPWWGALLLSAAAFGVNHYYFGLRNVAAKFVSGLVWGGLFLLTGSLLIPVVAHATFNILALHLKIEIEWDR